MSAAVLFAVKQRIGRRRFLRLFFILLLVALWTAPLYAAQVLRVEIPGVVQLEGEACAISDIAKLTGPQELKDRIGELLLSVRDNAITREQVIEALKVSGLEGVRVELKMPASVTVEDVPVTVVTDDTFSPSSQQPEKQQNQNRKQQNQNKEELVSLIKSLSTWDGEVEVQYQGTVPGGRLVSPSSLTPGVPAATLKFQDTAGRERVLAVRLVWSQSVLVLTRSVKKDQPLQESDVVVRQTRISRPGIYASRPSEVVGRSLRKNLSQGEAVPLDLLANVPIIERGKSVTIIVRSGGIMVKTKGEALESGALGQSIKVRNLSSKTVLTAVVMAKDTVEVSMP